MKKSLAIAHAVKKMAKGGKAKGVHSGGEQEKYKGQSLMGTEMRKHGEAKDPEHKEIHKNNARHEAREALQELKSMPKPPLPMARGGSVHNYASEGEDEMLGRIMKSRDNCYSEGGRVANGGDNDLDRMADGRPNNFDDLALRDDLEFSYTGDNSGDHLGNEQEDEDRHDIIARIMASRSKKDRNPRPA